MSATIIPFPNRARGVMAKHLLPGPPAHPDRESLDAAWAAWAARVKARAEATAKANIRAMHPDAQKRAAWLAESPENAPRQKRLADCALEVCHECDGP